jgi:hypothetical protein
VLSSRHIDFELPTHDNLRQAETPPLFPIRQQHSPLSGSFWQEIANIYLGSKSSLKT